MDIKEKLQQLVHTTLKNLGYDASVEIEIPKDKSHGDFSTNVAMKLAGQLKENPVEIAEEIASSLKSQEDNTISGVEVVKPGFINFKIEKTSYLSVLQEINKKGDNFGSSKIGDGKNVIVEFSSPNIAKPFTIGHLRSTIIGDSIARILEFSGYTVFRDNHLGDWGASFGKYLAAFEYYKKEGVNIKSIKKSERPIKELVDLYIRFTEDSEADPKLKELGREWFKRLEDGDKTAKDLWEECIDISFIEFDKVYKQLNVVFTENKGRGYGESFFEDKMPAILEELKDANDKGLIDYRKSEGAWLVFFPKNEMPPLMILKSNGTTLYSTRDLATDKFRREKKEYGYPNLTVVNEFGVEQSLYAKQLFKVEEMLAWYKPGQRIHIGHGLYRFKEGKMSTRKGNVIWLEDVLKEAVDRAYDKSQEKVNNETIDTEWVNTPKDDSHFPEGKDLLKPSEYIVNSEKIGIGAIKWNDLKRDPKQDILFDWDEILNLKGNSSPYIQYTYVRANKIGKTDTWNFERIVPNQEETEVLSLLSQFEEVIKSSAKNYQSSLICNYLFNLAQAYSVFYEKNRILNIEDNSLRNFRIALSQATAQVIKNGLNLLGIEVVEKM